MCGSANTVVMSSTTIVITTITAISIITITITKVRTQHHALPHLLYDLGKVSPLCPSISVEAELGGKRMSPVNPLSICCLSMMRSMSPWP